MGKDRHKKTFRKFVAKPYTRGRDSQRGGMQRRTLRGGRPAYDKVGYIKVNLREEEVGITEFVVHSPGFTGVLKSRISDFHVNEIDEDGKVLQLTDLTVPQATTQTMSEEEVLAARKELDEFLTADIWEKLKALSLPASTARDAMPDDIVEVDISALDKKQRTMAHEIIKQNFGGKLVSKTVNKSLEQMKAGDAADAGAAIGTEDPSPEQDVQRFLHIMKPLKSKEEKRAPWGFPGEYVHFLVHKTNVDTSYVAMLLAKKLSIRPSQVNYCGTKDKRGVTTQKFCVHRRYPAHIANAAKSVYNVYVGNFEFSDHVLKLGMMKGNRFRIAIRHVQGDQDEIHNALRKLRECGFINYYGMQRFGNSVQIPTHQVGVALLKRDYKLACELILKPRDNDLLYLREIREAWWADRDSAAALAKFRHSDHHIEKRLLEGLAEYGNKNYAAALRKIPRNMLLLYPHALQSLIFNRIASRRIKEFGLDVMPGDLVYRSKEQEAEAQEAEAQELELEAEGAEEETIDSEEAQAVAAAYAATLAEIATNEAKEAAGGENADATTSAAAKTDASDAVESAFKRKVKPLTEEDIASSQYNIFDVVLALPGYDVTYPDNVVGTWYEEMLQEYELSSESLRHKDKTFAMGGAYRKLLIQPTQMSWKFRGYDNPESTLIKSDWELLNEAKNRQPDDNSSQLTVLGAGTSGKYKALLLDFRLPTAAYATMLLRELLKTDTSAGAQWAIEAIEIQKVVRPGKKVEAPKVVERPGWKFGITPVLGGELGEDIAKATKEEDEPNAVLGEGEGEGKGEAEGAGEVNPTAVEGKYESNIELTEEEKEEAEKARLWELRALEQFCKAIKRRADDSSDDDEDVQAPKVKND